MMAPVAPKLIVLLGDSGSASERDAVLLARAGGRVHAWFPPDSPAWLALRPEERAESPQLAAFAGIYADVVVDYGAAPPTA